MNYKSLLILFFTLLLGCEHNNLNKNVVDKEIVSKYKNSGFTLVYNTVQKKISKNYV